MRRRPQVDTRQALDPLRFQAPVVDPDGVAGPLQGRVGLFRPRRPRLLQSGFGLQRLDARERHAARKLDTRRKLLAGAMVLDRVARGVLTEQLFLRDMDEFLQRDRDRALFGLPKQQEREKGGPQA